MVSPSGFGGGNGDDPNRRGGKNWWDFSGSNWDMNTIFSMKDISPKTQAHLTRVYTALFGATASCAFGMYINTSIMLTGFLSMICYMLFMGFSIY